MGRHWPVKHSHHLGKTKSSRQGCSALCNLVNAKRKRFCFILLWIGCTDFFFPPSPLEINFLLFQHYFSYTQVWIIEFCEKLNLLPQRTFLSSTPRLLLKSMKNDAINYNMKKNLVKQDKEIVRKTFFPFAYKQAVKLHQVISNRI